MKLRELRTHFTKHLEDAYPSEEIGSFFTLLANQYLSLNRHEISLNLDTKVSEEKKEIFENAIKRLNKYEPIQYVIGKTEFFSLPFKVNKFTLIPRPETEELVQWILLDLNSKKNSSSTKILDIGTGSGCIAISLAKNLPKATVSAIDFKEETLAIANQNSQLNEVTVTFILKDILHAQTLHDTYDIIVSNPPYVRESEKIQMQSNVLEHEPASALYVSDNDPLVFYIKIAQIAKRQLNSNGILYFEINEYLSKEVVTMLKNEGFAKIEVRKDFFGKERMIKAQLNA